MQIEIRADNTALITGYVNVAGRESRVLRDASGPFVEVVQPGTFQRALEKNPVGLMFNHRQALGSTEDVLELKEDNIGLYARALVHDSDIVEKAKAGQLTGWSFGFFVDKDEWNRNLPDYAPGGFKRFYHNEDYSEMGCLHNHSRNKCPLRPFYSFVFHR